MNADPNNSVAPPSLVEWDFDRAGCPAEELEHCCFYEYALEHRGVRAWVTLWRRKGEHLLRPENKFLRTIHDRPAFRILADLAHFPRNHWLEINTETRIQITKAAMSLRSPRRLCSPVYPRRYSGPQGDDLIRLQDSIKEWRLIRRAQNDLNVWYYAAQEQGPNGSADRLCNLLSKTESDRPCPVLSEARVAEWRRRLTGVRGEAFLLVVGDIYREVRQEIERYHRPFSELVPYEIDWLKRDGELVETFRHWLKHNRVHEAPNRGGGHPTRAVELLKQLGAKRLLAFFRGSRTSWPAPYRSLTLYAALGDYTCDQRSKAGRPAKPLYGTPSSWLNAESQVLARLKSFF